VEDRHSQIFTLDRVRPATVADGLAELQVRWPNVPIVFCETRTLAEEWTYQYLAAAHTWASTEPAAAARIGPVLGDLDHAPCGPNRPPPRSAPGPATTASPCPTGAGCAPRCGTPGAPHTPPAAANELVPTSFPQFTLLAGRPAFASGERRPPLVYGDLVLISTRLADGGVTVEVARRGPGRHVALVDRLASFSALRRV
jgi:hypothetical protein